MSLIDISNTSKKSFHACNSVTHEGESNTWFTPKEIVTSLGDFDLDPCTESYRPFDTAKKHFCFDLGDNGLSEAWFGRVWLNPPYGKTIGTWLAKLANHGNGIALVFSRTETSWAQDAFKVADGIFFKKGRIQFIKRDFSKSNSAANGSLFLIYGYDNLKYFESRKDGFLVKSGSYE